jgi:dolichol kinase
MTLRLHRKGRFRGWLGGRFGGDADLGDRIWRRVLHGLCAIVLLYYLLPENFFLIAPKWVILLAALAAVLFLEVLRHAAGLELPTIRAYEQRRIASFAFFAVALVIAVLLFPMPVGAAVVLGTALVDPLAGELRTYRARPTVQWGAPIAAYFALAWVGLAVVGRWPAIPSVALALIAAPVAIVVERRMGTWLDDDLLMTLVPALLLLGLGVYALHLPA